MEKEKLTTGERIINIFKFIENYILNFLKR